MGCLKLAYSQHFFEEKPAQGFFVTGKKVAQMWLSVDPLSDKYPATSPYAYCANNPVILVDPNGMYWETSDDQLKANELKHSATNSIKMYKRAEKRDQKRIDKLESKGKNPEEVEQLKSNIIALKENIQLLEEGIAGLQAMENKTDVAFHFNIDAERRKCNVTQTRIDSKGNNTIEMNAACDDTAWHEMIHVTDYLNKKFNKKFENGILSTPRGELYSASEIHAYKSEYIFSGNRDIFKSVKKLSDIDVNFIMKASKLGK